jgi:hypothetical protein
MMMNTHNDDNADHRTVHSVHGFVFGMLLEQEENTTVTATKPTTIAATTTDRCNRKMLSSLPLLCAWEDGFQLYDVIQGIELSAIRDELLTSLLSGW